MLDRFCELTETTKKEVLAIIVSAISICLSLFFVLSIIYVWIAVVIYWLLPFSLESGEASAIRIVLTIGGSVLIGVTYMFALYSIVVE